LAKRVTAGIFPGGALVVRRQGSEHDFLARTTVRELARTGGEVTIKRLRAEIIAIERTFPELRLRQR
jgi:hypothetical protein